MYIQSMHVQYSFLLFEVVFTAFQIQRFKRFYGSTVDVGRQISLSIALRHCCACVTYTLLETAEC